ncbi:type II secretion system F family protein [uncultured Clostridium sp.]|uniref:Type II secretion system F family protein n=1 Tax=Clostridium lapidicellarium TaxID=3240931 RepID=A0ABV4DVN5_9CLOT|nr:type II secretion system F family protein [uncultured Clostridium sp.]
MNTIVRYSAINIQGEKVRGRCEGYEFVELKSSLKEKGYYIYDRSIVKSHRKIFFKKPNMMDISVLCSQLSIMLSAGIPVSKVFDELENQYGTSSAKYILKAVKEEVIKGKNLYESMAQFKHAFPVFMINMVKVGEESGRLDEIFKKLSEYYEKCYSVISSIKTSLIYPAVTLAVSVFILLFLMIDIVPQFIDIIISNGGEVPALTKIVMFSCQFLGDHCLQILGAFVLICIVYCRFRKKSKVVNAVENIKIRIPYFNKVFSDLTIFKICSSMAILTSSGVNIIDSLKITGELLGNNILSGKIEESIKYIEGGEDVCGALKRAGIDDKLFLSLVKTGEDTGNMDGMFLKLEQLFGSKLDRYLKKMTKIVEPLIIICLSLFVGIFIISALMPIFSIMDSTL